MTSKNANPIAITQQSSNQDAATFINNFFQNPQYLSANRFIGGKFAFESFRQFSLTLTILKFFLHFILLFSFVALRSHEKRKSRTAIFVDVNDEITKSVAKPNKRTRQEYEEA